MRPPATVIPMPLHRETSPRDAGDPRKSQPFRALVVDRTAAARRLVCRLGEQAAGRDSHWLEASDADTASGMLAEDSIDLVVADFNSIRGGDIGMLTSAPGGRTQAPPIVVVLNEDDEPRQIQQMLDAGAECCMPKNLPPPILARELHRLVAELTASSRPSSFPKGS